MKLKSMPPWVKGDFAGGAGVGAGAAAVWAAGAWVVGAWSVSEIDDCAAAIDTNVADAISTVMQFFRIKNPS
jgi:hypothetical protein